MENKIINFKDICSLVKGMLSACTFWHILMSFYMSLLSPLSNEVLCSKDKKCFIKLRKKTERKNANAFIKSSLKCILHKLCCKTNNDRHFKRFRKSFYFKCKNKKKIAFWIHSLIYCWSLISIKFSNDVNVNP